MSNDVGLLAPYRVLDLTDESGWLCARILGDLGADVVKVEPVGGDAGRGRPPFHEGGSAPDNGLPWLAYNASKRGVTLNLETARGRDLFRRLAARADFVVESFAPGYLDGLWLSYGALSAANPRLVLTSITPFGQTGPYAHWRGSDLVAMATSGFMSLVGEPGQAPLRVTLPQAAMWTGMYAAAGTLIAHHYREVSGRGQQVDISLQAGMLWALANAPAFWSLNRENLRRNGNRVVGRNINGAAMRAIYPCRDGYINFIIYGGEAGRRSNEGMVAWMGEAGAAPDWLRRKDWGAFNVATCTQAEIDDVEREFAAFLAQRTKSEFRDRSVQYDIIGYPVNDARDIREDPQLAARDFWQAVPDGAGMLFPGPFAKFGAGTCAVRRPAPRVGEHNEVIYEELGLGREDLQAMRDEGVI
jgi:crotonobetainyl-CoA:carnitine CoA-transferase CaiB-like acyl-CoA transferase